MIDRAARLLHLVAATLHFGVALAIVLAALRLFLPPLPVQGPGILLAWFGFACGIGFVLARWWALLLAPLPQVGRWYTSATGPEYLTYGDGDGACTVLFVAVLIGTGLLGIALGVGARRRLIDFVTTTTTVPPRAVGTLVILIALLAMLAAAIPDWGQGRLFLQVPTPIAAKRYSEGEVRTAGSGLCYMVPGLLLGSYGRVPVLSTAAGMFCVTPATCAPRPSLG